MPIRNRSCMAKVSCATGVIIHATCASAHPSCQAGWHISHGTGGACLPWGRGATGTSTRSFGLRVPVEARPGAWWAPQVTEPALATFGAVESNVSQAPGRAGKPLSGSRTLPRHRRACKTRRGGGRRSGRWEHCGRATAWRAATWRAGAGTRRRPPFSRQGGLLRPAVAPMPVGKGAGQPCAQWRWQD